MILLAVVALLLSGYLAVIGLTTDTVPAGCGTDTGCGIVLASKWSKLLGIPTSALAVIVYALVIAALVMVRSPRAEVQRGAWTALLVAATLILGAAAWFIYLQAFEVKSICPYCMVDHVCGIALSVMILWVTLGRLSRLRAVSSIVVGLVAVLVLVIVQIYTPAPINRLPVTPVNGGGQTGSSGETIVLLGGQLKLNLNDEPLAGSTGAPHLLAIMFDYACPHCRHTHQLLHDLKTNRYGDDLAIVSLPVPLNRKCNAHAPQDPGPRFDQSCELANFALAVHLIDAGKFAQFDQWMFETMTPRTQPAARAYAARLVGEKALERALVNPRIAQIIERNTTAYGASGAGRIPVLITPHAAPIEGRVDRPGVIIDLLEGQ